MTITIHIVKEKESLSVQVLMRILIFNSILVFLQYIGGLVQILCSIRPFPEQTNIMHIPPKNLHYINYSSRNNRNNQIIKQ